MRKFFLFLCWSFTICKGQTSEKIFHDFNLFKKCILFDGNVSKTFAPNGDTVLLRYQGVNTIVDICSLNGKYTGTIGHYTWRIQYKKPGHGKIFCSKMPLDTGVARKASIVFMKLMSDSLKTMYGQDSLLFLGVTDGYSYVFSRQTSDTIIVKEYVCPPLFKDRIRQAAIIDSLHAEFYKLLNLGESHDQFFLHLPNGQYRVGAILIQRKESVVRRKLRMVLKKMR